MKKLKLFTIFLLITTLALARTITGRVLYVSDGDTLTMSVEGSQEKIRFYGIDAPEKSQDYGLEAKEFVLERVEDKVIQVRVVDRDRYGRSIGKIYYDDHVYLNEEVVKNGLAWWYEYYARGDRDLREAQEYARDKKLGLWKENSPVAPWEWRRGRRNPKLISTSKSTETGDRVYVSRSGRKYHMEGCHYLTSVGAVYSIEEAVERGYTPCSNYR